MGDYNDSSASSSLSGDDESEATYYAEIFQRLLSRYTNNRLPVCYDANSDYYSGGPPKLKHKPNTMKLDASDFYYSTKLNTTSTNKRRNLRPVPNTASLLSNREIGQLPNNHFSRASRCQIYNNYLPNKMEKMDTYRDKVFCGQFSKDGKYFITAAQDKQIRVYKTDGGKYTLFREFQARDIGWSIIDVAFSPNGEEFVYSTWSTTLHICSVNGDPEKQEPLCLLNSVRRFCTFSLSFSSDGKEIMGGANDGILYIYDREAKATTVKICAHEFDVNSVAFADDSSQIIYSGSDDGLIKVWDRRTWIDENDPKPVGMLAGHMDGITYISSKGDGRHLISNSKDQSIKLWDVRVFSSDCAAENTLRAVHSQSWDYRWQGVPKRLYNTKDRLDGDTSVMTYRGHIITRTLVRCKFSPVETTGQRFIYTGCGGGRLVIYDALTGKIKMDEREHTSCVRDVSWHPSKNEILTSSWDGSVGRWYYSTKETSSEKRKSPFLRRSDRIASKKRREQEVK
ncbi:PREDICTED: DDB1- and CUL4-associated factor 11 [Nicrophorus vespilloides]|uniref:DDB1- and CUL4-associated factor 11 n=1 Tax=Nicrophorus vespilloides TaxID=110193 RepID=A0ABM1MWS8_NICVS|nr:PREDICTED: DDB1- and CUL4-associated factor 11 [Nicrophorus vespilloides]